MKTFVKNHGFSTFLVLTFLLSWFPWYMGIAPEMLMPAIYSILADLGLSALSAD